LKKGRTAYVEGRLQTREWQDKDGGKRTATEIVASNVVFLGGRGSGEHEQPAPEAEPDNIPF
jgi:single-strand DNA-binding protein